jgi:hypothetical protein
VDKQASTGIGGRFDYNGAKRHINYTIAVHISTTLGGIAATIAQERKNCNSKIKIPPPHDTPVRFSPPDPRGGRSGSATCTRTSGTFNLIATFEQKIDFAEARAQSIIAHHM